MGLGEGHGRTSVSERTEAVWVRGGSVWADGERSVLVSGSSCRSFKVTILSSLIVEQAGKSTLLGSMKEVGSQGKSLPPKCERLTSEYRSSLPPEQKPRRNQCWGRNRGLSLTSCRMLYVDNP